MISTKVAKTPNSHALILITASAGCWGLGTVMSKSVLATVPPLSVLTVQLSTSILVLWVLSTLQGHTARLTQFSWFTWIQLGSPGVFEPGLSYGFGLIGLSLSSASQAALIGATEPVFIVGLAWLMFRESISLRLLMLSALAMIGVMLTVSSDTASGSQALLGNLWILIGTFCAAFYVILSRHAVANHPPLILSALQQTMGLVCIVLFSWNFGAGLQFSSTIPTQIWLLAALSGVVQYALAFWLYLSAIRLIPVSIAAQFLSLIPVFGVGGAYLFLGERLTLVQCLGMAITIAAVSQISRLQSSHE
ncbi:DMT family transporter [Leptolyngbya sp. FACHB-541]|uniref:DMT family transporter n=1 Tax=Leptolyngbya sp. FACHB-541 TaxID=2692810 RepID=UPI001689E3A5|nr:DMT family transporter [Leptolyngbya sp. FACHB-541]MBD1871297.1 DMT family transporter [Cyanobacteria bacterium FACHB-471]MBD2000876.1 DMT family transporter [Leptolyngbya sp. FACHB-541]